STYVLRALLLLTPPPPPPIVTLSLHDALPISSRFLGRPRQHGRGLAGDRMVVEPPQMALKLAADVLTLKTKHPFVIARGELQSRSEEHTSELQSRVDLVCRRLLEKKKNTSTRC